MKPKPAKFIMVAPCYKSMFSPVVAMQRWNQSDRKTRCAMSDKPCNAGQSKCDVGLFVMSSSRNPCYPAFANLPRTGRRQSAVWGRVGENHHKKLEREVRKEDIYGLPPPK
jgi:hypothetical protein